MAKIAEPLPMLEHRWRMVHARLLAEQRGISIARAFNLIGELDRRFKRGFWNEDPREFWAKPSLVDRYQHW